MTKYSFDEAIMRCGPGQIVKHSRAGWSEHDIQYGRHPNDTAYWTAGWTVGGDLVSENVPHQNDIEWEVWENQRVKVADND